MFTEVSFNNENWNQCKSPLIGDCINKMYLPLMKNYAAVKMNELSIWINTGKYQEHICWVSKNKLSNIIYSIMFLHTF